MCKECCGMPMESETCSCHHTQRRFFTKAERIQELEEYLEELTNESKAVMELIDELKG